MLRKKVGIYWIIFIVAVLIRLFYVFNYDIPLYGDESSYHSLALSIIEDGDYIIDGSSYSRPPLYPFFISIVFFLFGKKLIMVRIAQAVIDALLCVFVYKLTKDLFNRGTALIASFFSVFYLLFISATPHLLTETVFTFLLFITIYVVYKTKERPSLSNIFILGFFIAVITLVKGIMLLLVPFLFLVLLITRYYDFGDLKEIMKKVVICVLGFVLVMSFWTYRNYKVYNAFVPVSTQGGYALYDCYFPKDGKIFGLNVMDENVRYAKSLGSQVEMSKYLAKKTLEFIKANPVKVLRLEILKFFYFWAPFDWEIIGHKKGIYNFQYVFMIPFALFGMFLLSKHIEKHAFLYVPILYFLFMSLIFYGSPRFRMPIEPYLIIFFAVGISRFFSIFRYKYKPILLTIFYLFINFTMYLRSDLTKNIFKSLFECIGLW